LDTYSEAEKAEFLRNTKVKDKTRLERELTSMLGCYNKSNPDTSCFIGSINTAIHNAKLADTDPSKRWIIGLGSRVYLLVEQII